MIEKEKKEEAKRGVVSGTQTTQAGGSSGLNSGAKMLTDRLSQSFFDPRRDLKILKVGTE